MTKPAKIILVDDDPLIIESLSFVLSDEFEVVSAASRAQAKSLMQTLEVSPVLALVDLGLPPTPHLPEEGFQLIEELLAFNQNMKILVLSGQSERANIQHALTLGAVDFVPKPCDSELLRSRLRHQLLILDAEQTQSPNDEKHTELLLGESNGNENLAGTCSAICRYTIPGLDRRGVGVWQGTRCYLSSSSRQ